MDIALFQDNVEKKSVYMQEFQLKSRWNLGI